METSLLYVCLFALLCSARSQEIHAEQYGTVEVEVKQITLDDFLPLQETFRDVVSWHVSRFCKQKENNCWAEDKQIRRFDIIIQNSLTSKDNVNVEFYIRDRYDHTRAGLENHQVRDAFQQYGGDIEEEFQYEMEVISPGEQGMEPWLIAVICVSCVVGVALIITIIVLACRQCDYDDKMSAQNKLTTEQLRKEYSMSVGEDFTPRDSKINPGFDTDRDSDDSDSDKSSSSGGKSPNKHSPPPDYYNNDKTGAYSLVDPGPALTATTIAAKTQL